MSTYTAKQFDGTLESACRLTTWMDALGHDGWTIQQWPKLNDVVLLVSIPVKGMVECKADQYVLHYEPDRTWHVVNVLPPTPSQAEGTQP